MIAWFLSWLSSPIRVQLAEERSKRLAAEEQSAERLAAFLEASKRLQRSEAELEQTRGMLEQSMRRERAPVSAGDLVARERRAGVSASSEWRRGVTDSIQRIRSYAGNTAEPPRPTAQSRDRARKLLDQIRQLDGHPEIESRVERYLAGVFNDAWQGSLIAIADQLEKDLP